MKDCTCLEHSLPRRRVEPLIPNSTSRERTGVSIDQSPFAPIYSVAIVLWAILFAKFWRRQEALLALRWGTMWLDHHSEVRPQYKGANSAASEWHSARNPSSGRA